MNPLSHRLNAARRFRSHPVRPALSGAFRSRLPGRACIGLALLLAPSPAARAGVESSVYLSPMTIVAQPDLNVWEAKSYTDPSKATDRYKAAFRYNDSAPDLRTDGPHAKFKDGPSKNNFLPPFNTDYVSLDLGAQANVNCMALTHRQIGPWSQSGIHMNATVRTGPVRDGAKVAASLTHLEETGFDVPATPSPGIHNYYGYFVQILGKVAPPEGVTSEGSHHEAVIRLEGDFGTVTLTMDEGKPIRAELQLNPGWEAYKIGVFPQESVASGPIPIPIAKAEEALVSGYHPIDQSGVLNNVPIMLLKDIGPGEFRSVRSVSIETAETVITAPDLTYTEPVGGSGVNEVKSLLVFPAAPGQPPPLLFSTGNGQLITGLSGADATPPITIFPQQPPPPVIYLPPPPPPLRPFLGSGGQPPHSAVEERVTAGVGTLGSGGDGGLAALARFQDVTDMARDGQGNVFLIDNESGFSGRIRRVDSFGFVATVAGGGSDNNVEGMKATEARLRPTGIAVDDQDRLFLSDDRTRRIYQLGGDDTLTTVAGSGGTDSNGDKGPALQASIAAPGALAFGPGGVLYLRDGNKLRFVTPGGTIDSLPLSGEGGGDIGFLGGMVVDPNGTLYVADLFSHHVNTVTPDGKVSLFAGSYRHGFAYGDGGKAIDAGLTLPSDVDLDAAGNVYIADSGAGRLRKVDKDGIISTVAGRHGPTGDGGKATLAELFAPSGIARDAEGNLYVADTNHHLIRRIDVNDIITTVAGSGLLTGNGVSGFSGDDGPATSAMLNTPVGVAVDAAHNLYIADTLNHRIRRVTPDGKIDTVAGTGDADFSGDNGPALQAKLNNPTGIAVDGNGAVFFADSFNQRIRKFTPGGTITTVAGSGVRGFEGDGSDALFSKLSNPYGVATDGAGNLFIADTFNHRIRKVGTDGKIDTLAGNSGLFSSGGYTGDGGPAKDADLALPYGVSVGPDGTVYIADSGNNVVRAVTPDGKIDTVLGTGETGYSDGISARTSAFRFPQALVAGADGALWVADTVNSRIRQVGHGFASPKPVPLGDVNFDESIDVGDAVLVLQKIVGLADLQNLEAQAADITCDGGIDVSDGVKILRVAVELEPGPAGCAP